MTDATSDNSFMDDAQPENDLRLGKMADALGCTAKLIQETWQMLGIDSFDDPHELSSVQEAADIYLSAGKHAARLSEMLSSLPEAEVERLTVERNDVVKSSIVSARGLLARSYWPFMRKESPLLTVIQGGVGVIRGQINLLNLWH